MLIPWTFSSYSTFPPNILHIPNILDSPPCLQRFFFFHFVCCSITSVYNSAWHTVRSQYRFVKLISGSIRGELSLSQCRRSKRRGHNRLNTRFRPSDAALDLTQPEDSPCLNSTVRSQHACGELRLDVAPGSFQAAKCRVIDQLPHGPPVSRWGHFSRHPTSRDIQIWRKRGLTGFPLQCSKALCFLLLGSTGYLPTRGPKQPSTAASGLETWCHPLHKLPVTRHHGEPLKNQISGAC